MALTQGVFSVGTAATTVVAPTNDFARYIIKNLEPATIDQSSRAGDIFLVEQLFPVTVALPVSFSLVTNSTGMQFDFYSIVSDTSNVLAELIESPTVTVTGSAIATHNLNRNKSDSVSAVLKAATAVSGGTVVSAEYMTASKAAGGAGNYNKMHTLKPNTQYAMRFTNQGNQTTNIFFQLGFSEKYNGYNSAWLGTPNDSFVIHAQESLEMTLNPYETINATALIDGVQLSVLRQEY